MQLIYLSPVPWSSFSQRPHKFVEWFHAMMGKDVLWIDPYPTRFPWLSDFRRLDTPKPAEKKHKPSWIKIIIPKAIPIEPLPGSGLLNALLWTDIFDEIKYFSCKESTLLAIGKPSVLALIILKQLKKVPSLYDAMDDFSAFYSNFSSISMKWRENRIVKKVTHVLVSSTALKRRWNCIRSDVQLIPNGLDAKLLPEPGMLHSKNGNLILGYVGTIGPWFDWDWIIALASSRPKDLVRLIGPVFVAAPGHSLPENVEMLPPCNHVNALHAMQDFNIGLIPFKKNKLTESVDPIKYYEYRALGLPVVSTNFGEMSFRSKEDGIFISRSKRDINQLVEKALLSESDSNKTRMFIRSNTWEARFSEINFRDLL